MNQNTKIFGCEVNEETGQIEQLYDQYDLNYLPPGIVRNEIVDGKNLNRWWLERSIPDGRKGIRDALEEMGLDNPKCLITKGYGLSLSDQYWICPEGKNLHWKDINYFDHDFTDYVGNKLLGKNTENEEIDLASPCNTSGGNLIKKWVIEDGKRYLIKGGSGAYLQEPFNEVLASSIHNRLGIYPYVDYKLIWEDEKPFCKCENMILNDKELVSAYQVLNFDKKLNETSYYQHLIQMCSKLEVPDVQTYLDYMLITDYIIGNVDRHYNNFGFIRDVNTLKYEGIAPLYDSGNSMWFDTSTVRIDYEKDIPSMPFKKIHSEQIQLVSSFERIDLKKLQGIEEEFASLLITSPDIDQSRIQKLCEGLKYRTNCLEEIKEHSAKKALYVTNDESIKREIKNAGYKVTHNLVNNIRKLNELQSKDMTFDDIKVLDTKDMGKKEKYLVKAIINECSAQAENYPEPEL